MKRVTFYIDGFNFYFGLKSTMKLIPGWSRYYWIDIVKLCESFLGNDQTLVKVIYFTASPLDKDKNSRQSAFLNANKAINGERFEIVRGRYLNKTILCPFCNSSISRPEEKKTDVNICLRMIEDCITDTTDVISLVSADSDLLPSIQMINKFYQDKKVKVYFSPSRFSREINDYQMQHKSKPIMMIFNEPRFHKAIMPFNVSNGTKTYIIPEEWKKHFTE